MSTWTKTNDYYNREVVTCDVYSRPVKRVRGKGGMLYVMNKDNFTYTCSMGANSDYSYTGCFFECTKITNVNEAMIAIDKIVKSIKSISKSSKSEKGEELDADYE